MSAIEPSMFREYDVRGLVNDEQLNPRTMELLGRAFGTYLDRRGVREVVIGYDARTYSEALKDACVRGLVAAGRDVTDLGMVLVPMLYFAQYHLKVNGGVMITASHNPNGWSGVKLAPGLSQTLVQDELQEVYKIIISDAFVSGTGSVRTADVKEAYLQNAVSRVKPGRKLKVAVDCGNGAAGPFTPEALRRAGAEIVELFCDIDTTFPNHWPNPSLLAARVAMAAKVRETGADLGIGIDADGDRLGVVDERGENVWTDKVSIFWVRQVLERQPGAKIVFDVKTSWAMPEDIRAHGGVPIMWKTGHSWIKRKAHEIGAAFAAEKSGHIFFFDNYHGFDDATFAALRLTEYLSHQDQPLSRLMLTIPQYVTSPEYHAECADSVKYQIVDELTAEFKREYGATNVIDISGARVEFDDSWGLVRASANLPQLVLGFEAKTQERLEQIEAIFRAKLDRYPEVNKQWENE